MRLPIVPFALLALAAGSSVAAMKLQVESVRKIWGEAPHSAFGDLLYHDNRWWCIFREGSGHIPKQEDGSDDGKIRVITSRDGVRWKSEALIAEAGVDLRDPHLSVMADGRLMIVAGGSRYRGTKYLGRRPRVMISGDGIQWSKPQAVLDEGMWLWRVTWHEGRAWGVTKYGSAGAERQEDPRRANVVSSVDGLNWKSVSEFRISGPDETTLRFLKDETIVALVRRATAKDHTAAAWIGHSRPPYTEWSWSPLAYYVGGPNFVVLPDGRMIAGGRYFAAGDKSNARTAIGEMTLTGYQPALELPSGGDSSYPGMVWHGNRLWVSYYSSHEGKAQIYLAKVRVR